MCMCVCVYARGENIFPRFRDGGLRFSLRLRMRKIYGGCGMTIDKRIRVGEILWDLKKSIFPRV